MTQYIWYVRVSRNAPFHVAVLSMVKGSVERLGKELLLTARAIISELQMNFDEWPDFLQILQSVINNYESRQ